MDIQLALGDGRGGESGGEASHPALTFKEVWSVSSQSLASNNTTTLTTPVDVVVSELLGSFGDNELSPECIEGFMDVAPWRDEGERGPSKGCDTADCVGDDSTALSSTSTLLADPNYRRHHRGQSGRGRRPVCIPSRYQSVIEPNTSYRVVELLRGLVGKGGGVPTGIPRHQRTDCPTHRTADGGGGSEGMLPRPAGAARALHVTTTYIRFFIRFLF
jgi:hypothetical protein